MTITELREMTDAPFECFMRHVFGIDCDRHGIDQDVTRIDHNGDQTGAIKDCCSRTVFYFTCRRRRLLGLSAGAWPLYFSKNWDAARWRG